MNLRLDPSRAIGTYAAVMTAIAAWTLLAGVGAVPPTRFDTIDVKRINVRENDGTLRMIIAGSDHIGGLVIDGKEYPHPNRTEAGLIFLNDEGTENGGLVFDGANVNGKPTNSGHLSFDRWHQDQTLYFESLEDGDQRRAGVFVEDRPDRPADFPRVAALRAMPDGPGKDAAFKAAGLGKSMRRAFLGRDFDGASKLVLRDGQGRARLTLQVDNDGAARIDFLDAAGKVVRSQTAAGL